LFGDEVIGDVVIGVREGMRIGDDVIGVREGVRWWRESEGKQTRRTACGCGCSLTLRTSFLGLRVMPVYPVTKGQQEIGLEFLTDYQDALQVQNPNSHDMYIYRKKLDTSRLE
jgi:hypothetical protein